jgi:hypothetical protein
MSAVNTDEAILTEQQCFDVAAIRARGGSWEDAARASGVDAAALRRAARAEPLYRTALEWARREVAEEVEAELQHRLLDFMDSDDQAEARRAAETLADFRLRLRRDETELALARVAAEAELAQAKLAAETKLEAERLAAEARLEAERIRAASREECARIRAAPHASQRQHEEWDVDCDADDRPRRGGHDPRGASLCDSTEVYLWGGCHSMGVGPDATDTPLALRIQDGAVPGKRMFWAMPSECRLDPWRGPFLPPPGMCVNLCPVFDAP